ncbi:UNVERIFIED_ORG: TraB family protein [Zoogloea ramigera]
MRNLSMILTLCAMCFAGAAHATAAGPLPPRLVAAERNGQLIFLLPETHAGMRSQYDRYFKTVIAPAFVASSLLLSERSSPVQAESSLRYQACPDEHADEAQVDPALNAALPEVLPTSHWGVFPPSAPVTGFSRFMRFQLVFEDAYFNSTGRNTPPWELQPAPELPARLTTNYATRLMLDDPRPYASVDTPASSYHAYCSLAPAQRTALARAALQMRLRQAGHAPPLDQLGKPEDAAEIERRELEEKAAKMDANYWQWVQRIALAINTSNAAATAMAEDYPTRAPNQLDTDRYLLAARNREWLARLPQMTAGQRLPFMVLGAAHLPDTAAGPGLLRLLREAGYRLTLVRDHAQLTAMLHRLPPPLAKPSPSADQPWQRTVLDGQCTDIPHGELCGWAGGGTVVTLADKGTAYNRLTVCVTHDTAWGPRNNCSTTDVPRH